MSAEKRTRSSSEHAHRHVLHPAWLLEWDARFRTAGAIILADIGALVCCQRPQGSRFFQPTRGLRTTEAGTAMRETRCMSVVVFLPLQRAPPSRVPQSLLVLPRLETQGFGAARTNVWLRRPFAFARHLASCCLVSRYEPSFMCASREVTCTPWAQHVKSSHRVRPS